LSTDAKEDEHYNGMIQYDPLLAAIPGTRRVAGFWPKSQIGSTAEYQGWISVIGTSVLLSL
jgi:hypothetical protein